MAQLEESLSLLLNKSTKIKKGNPMKKVIAITTLSLVLILGACNQGTNNAVTSNGTSKDANTLSVTIDGKTHSVTPVSSGILTSSITDSVAYNIVLMNYEFSGKMTKMRVYKSAKKEGSKRIQLTLIGAKGADENAPLAPGEYATNIGNSGSPFGKTTDGKFYFSENGKENSRGLNSPDIKAGKVVIESVDNGLVKGTVDITDGALSIKGPFSVKIS